MDNNNFFRDYGYVGQNGFDSREKQLADQGLTGEVSLIFGEGYDYEA